MGLSQNEPLIFLPVKLSKREGVLGGAGGGERGFQTHHSVSSLSGSSRGNFGGVLKRKGPEMCTFGAARSGRAAGDPLGDPRRTPGSSLNSFDPRLNPPPPFGPRGPPWNTSPEHFSQHPQTTVLNTSLTLS